MKDILPGKLAPNFRFRRQDYYTVYFCVIILLTIIIVCNRRGETTVRKTVREIEREFAGLLQEGYAHGYLTHSDTEVVLTASFTDRYQGFLQLLTEDQRATELVEEILHNLDAPASNGPDYAHMQLFITRFLAAVIDDPINSSLADRIVQALETEHVHRRAPLDALLGLGAMYLYYRRYPPTVDTFARSDISDDDFVEFIVPGARVRAQKFKELARQIRAIGPVFIDRDALPEEFR